MAKYTVSLGQARKVAVFDDVRNPLLKVTRTLGGTNNFANKILQFNSDGELLPVTTPAASIPDGDKGDVTTAGAGSIWTIDDEAVTNAKLANMAQATVKGRAASAGTGDPTDLTADQVSTILDTATDPFLRTSAGGGGGITQLTGDVTAGPGSGSQAATVANAAITNAKMANMAQDTIKGRVSGSGTGAPVDLTATEVRTILNVANGANAYTHPNHSGDVTSSGDGATTIANSAVTYAKIQNVSATDKLLGRSTSGAGVVEEIACTAAGRNLLDDADAAAQRTTLGLGTMATQAANAVAITGGTIATLTSLGVTDITATGVTSVGFFRTPITSAAAIASGVVALGSGNALGMNLRLETEGLAASDDLDSITGGQDGWWLCISTNNSARDVVVKHSVATDKFQLVGAADFTLTTATSRLYVMRIANVWREMFRVTL